MKLFLGFLLIIFLINPIAQEIIFNQDSTAVGIQNNRFYFPLGNNGILADASSLENRSATYDGESIFFFSGFYLSGYSDTTLWANKTGEPEPALSGDYQAGNIGDYPEDSENIIYVVKNSDPPFGEAWQNWKTAVEKGAYFYDGDDDGVYNPIDKNGNGQWDPDEDKPDILYDAALFTVYNDGKPSNERNWSTVEPLGIEIRQTVFVSNRNTILDDVVFVRYSVLYKGLGNLSEPDSLTEVIFSIYSDCDLGSDFLDDLSGSDTLLESGYTYNDSTDESFGINPPSVFKTILQGPLVKSNDPNDIGYNRLGPDLGEQVFTGYKNGKLNSYIALLSGDPIMTLPINKTEARNNMLGLTRLGDQVDPCDWYFSEVRGDVDCSTINPFFWYSGDPVTDYGWINNVPADQRDLTSTGKFTLRKNEPIDIIVAYTVGRGTDYLNSITVARETVQYIHEEYERNFSTIVGVEEEEREELPSSFMLYQNYPNPFNPSTTINFAVPVRSDVKITVFNILGEVVEILHHSNIDAGKYSLSFDAANKLSSGIYFYQIIANGIDGKNFNQTKKMILLK